MRACGLWACAARWVSGPLDNALLAVLTGPFPPSAYSRGSERRLCVVPVIRRAMHVLAGGGALGRGTWHPASPAAPSGGTYGRPSRLASRSVVPGAGGPPRTMGIQSRRGPVVQARRAPHPGTLFFLSPRDLCGLPVGCQISPVGRERDFARSATCTTKRPMPGSG